MQQSLWRWYKEPLFKTLGMFLVSPRACFVKKTSWVSSFSHPSICTFHMQTQLCEKPQMQAWPSWVREPDRLKSKQCQAGWERQAEQWWAAVSQCHHHCFCWGMNRQLSSCCERSWQLSDNDSGCFHSIYRMILQGQGSEQDPLCPSRTCITECKGNLCRINTVIISYRFANSDVGTNTDMIIVSCKCNFKHCVLFEYLSQHTDSQLNVVNA